MKYCYKVSIYLSCIVRTVRVKLYSKISPQKVVRFGKGRQIIPVLFEDVCDTNQGWDDSSMHRYIAILFPRYVSQYYFL